MKKVSLIILALTLALFQACTQETKKEGSEEGSMKENMESNEGDSSEEPIKVGYRIETLNDSIPSPRMEMSGKVGSTDVIVNYGSPRVNSRAIWGDLVEFDKTWRTGANEATTVEFSENVIIDGEELEAGKYALFTVPSADGPWKVIFNSESDQWGAYKKDNSKDVLTIELMPDMDAESAEDLAFMIEGNSIILVWEKLHLAIPVESASSEG